MKNNEIIGLQKFISNKNVEIKVKEAQAIINTLNNLKVEFNKERKAELAKEFKVILNGNSKNKENELVDCVENFINK